MKKKLLKACSLLLAISMLIIPASIVSGAEGISDVEAVGTSVALDGSKDTVAKVGIAFTADVYCYGIQGTWDMTATNNAEITLGSIEFCGDEATFTDDDDYVSPTTGNVMWTDLEFIGGKFSKGSKLLTATYKIPADTAPGEYKVGFLCEVYTDASGFPVEFENTYLEATITVTCDRPPVLQPGQASDCDTDGWKSYYKCNVCGKYYTDAEGNNPIDDIETWKTGDGKIPAGHPSTEVTYANVTETTHDEYYACCGVVKATGVEHTYDQENNTECRCGAKMPAADDEILYGDADGNGEVDILDEALLSQYNNGWEVTLNELNADANGDGSIDILDEAMLSQYNNGWDVTLGPKD